MKKPMDYGCTRERKRGALGEEACKTVVAIAYFIYDQWLRPIPWWIFFEFSKLDHLFMDNNKYIYPPYGDGIGRKQNHKERKKGDLNLEPQFVPRSDEVEDNRQQQMQ